MVSSLRPQTAPKTPPLSKQQSPPQRVKVDGANPSFPEGKSPSKAITSNTGGANPSFPATKAQLYNATCPVYRFLVITLVILAAIADHIFYALYCLERPTFAVNSLHLSQFNLSTTTLTSKLNISISTRNPNKKLTYFYDPITNSTFSRDIPVGIESFPMFEHGTKNTTTSKQQSPPKANS
ncbi:uncharacterized protein LOC116007946 [Ipomoea triloba]|uniref:uncharacterized protein LOC116007946 n=1 Tax=Ipomoea triloba TaxID=35885 RepID=UPI00125D344D|nr:uncharacterized protein LOC116007946 [Ipomoea triloba]